MQESVASTGQDNVGGIAYDLVTYCKDKKLPLVAYEGGVGFATGNFSASYGGKLVGNEFKGEGGKNWDFKVQKQWDNPSEQIGKAGAIAIQLDNGGGAFDPDVYIVGSTDIRDDKWHHVVAVLPEGKNNLKDVLLYVDGAKETISASSDMLINTSEINDVRIFGSSKYDNFTKGNIDNVQIYSRGLSDAEVASLFAGNEVTGSLEAQWKLDGDGTDVSGNNRALTFPNAYEFSSTAKEGTHSFFASPWSNNAIANAEGYKGIKGSNARTISAWIKTTANDAAIVSWGDPGVVFWELAGLAAIKSGKGDVNNNPLTDFLATMLRDPRVADVYRTTLNLYKASDLRMHSNFGDINGMTKWGSWSFLEYSSQDLAQAPRYTFIKEWGEEQKSIREISDPAGNVPRFDTGGDMPVAVKGDPYSFEISYSGGDGELVCEKISKLRVPAGMTLEIMPENKKVVLNGTPTEAGNFPFLLRLLDADKDPAWRIFKLRVVERTSAPTAFIDFEDQTITPNDSAVKEPLVINGYKFTSNGNGSGNGMEIEKGDYSSKVLRTRFWGGVITMTKADEGVFDLTSFYYGAYPDGKKLWVTGYYNDGSVEKRVISVPGYNNNKYIINWIGLKPNQGRSNTQLPNR